MKNTVTGILRSKELMKDIFNALGYSVLIAGLAKIFLLWARHEPWYVMVVVAFAILFMLCFPVIFWLLHVIRPIIQLTWVEFGIPEIDPGVKKLPIKKLIARVDFWVFFIMTYLSIGFGWFLITALLDGTIA